jgi:hypothetical protein
MYVFECALMISYHQLQLLCRESLTFLCVSDVEGNIRTAVWIKVIGVVHVDAHLV